MASTYPDGTPRRSEDLADANGAVNRAQADMHAQQTLGSLNGAGVVSSDPRGNAGIVIGPGSAAWNRSRGAHPPFMTGSQSKR